MVWTGSMRRDAVMIGAIGPTGILRSADLLRGDAAVRATSAANAPTDIQEAAPQSPAALLAAEGAPIDGAKVAALRGAIADGSYRIDPRAIADKMIALDLPHADQ